jgi:hypothetical protein
MNLRSIFNAGVAAFMIAGCGGSNDVNDPKTNAEYPGRFELRVENPAAVERPDEAVVLNMSEIRAKNPGFNPNAFIVLSGGKEMASQADDLNGDGTSEQITFVSDFGPKTKKTFVIRYANEGIKTRPYPKRTQAELSRKFGGRFKDRKYPGGVFQNVQSLRVPPEHTDHSFFIRYEGPGWESDKAGYRFYLDWRNAIDFFGKKIPGMVLQNVGQDGFDSYHAMSDWGMDVLKVGESLGIGTLGTWAEGRAERVSKTDSVFCFIVANGPVRSQIRTLYSGWKAGPSKVDLVSDLSIFAGSRMTRHDVLVQGDLPNLCTGIVRMDSTRVLRPAGQKKGWTYLATYGKQSLNDDLLGLAVLFRAKDLIQTAEDKFSHVVVLKPEDGALTYGFLAAWELEPGGIRSAEAFVRSLEETVSRLDNPLVIRL